jgi:cyclophilin family peptidyl-prolyl cis-trans isomerase
MPGTLAMARGADPNSASCQFYITVSQMPSLDGSYTIFGQVIDGLSIARKISEVETKTNPALEDEQSMPAEPVYIIDARRIPQG